MSPRCAGPQAGICHHSNAGSHPLLCWEGNLGCGAERGIQNTSFQVRSAVVFAVGAGLGLPWEQAEAEGSGVRHSLALADRDQGSATDLCEISHHQMLFCIQTCSREHIPSGSNLGKFREKGYKQLCLQHNVFLANIQPIPLV